MTSSEEELKDALELVRRLQEHAEAPNFRFEPTQGPEGARMLQWIVSARMLLNGAAQSLERLSSDLAAAQEEAERRNNDYQSTCELVWRLYCAAMGESNDTFHGVPASNIVDLVEQHVAALNDAAIDADSLRRDLSASHQREEQMRRALERAERIEKAAREVAFTGTRDWPEQHDVFVDLPSMLELRRTLSEDSHDDG
jgi:hypothetical protein